MYYGETILSVSVMSIFYKSDLYAMAHHYPKNENRVNMQYALLKKTLPLRNSKPKMPDINNQSCHAPLIAKPYPCEILFYKLEVF